METQGTDLEEKVLRLSVKKRARLARLLLESLDAEDEGDVEAAWVEEAKRRYEEVRSGRVKSQRSSAVHARARAALSALK
jgi:putative addiction module component (TIGR02574 family)